MQQFVTCRWCYRRHADGGGGTPAAGGGGGNPPGGGAGDICMQMVGQ